MSSPEIKKTVALITAIVSAAFCTSTAHAEKMSLSDLIKLGLKRSPSLKKAEADLNTAIDTTAQYRGAIFPNVYLDMQAQSNRNSQTLTSLSTGSETGEYTQQYKAFLAATQPLYESGGLTGAISQRRVSEEIAGLTKISVQQAVITNIVGSYYGYAQQYRLFLAAKENTAILDAYNKIITRFERIGRARTTDRMLAEVNLVTARASENSYDSLVVAQKELLRQQLAVEELPDIDLEKDSTLTKIEKLNPSDAVAIAMRSNPDVISAEKQVDLIEANKEVDVSQDLPSLNLTGEVGYQSPDKPNWFDNSSQYGQIMLELKIPLFSGLSSIYKRRSYEEQKVSAGRAAEVEKFAVETSLLSQLKEVEAAFDRLALARDAALKARNALEIGNRDFQRSLISPQDMLSLQTSRYSAEQSFINTLYAYLNALLKTRNLMGLNLEASYVQK